MRFGALCRARSEWGRQEPIDATLHDDRYQFDVPPQIAAERLDVRVGDVRQSVQLTPLLRPELTSIVAEVSLPEYLGRPKQLRKDVRGGSVSLVKGSQVTFVATASRALSTAQVNGQRREPSAATIRSPEMLVKGPREVRIPLERRVCATRQGAVHAESRRVR